MTAVLRAAAPIPVCALAMALSWFVVLAAWDVTDELGVVLALALLVAGAVAVGRRTRFGLVWTAGSAVGGGAAALVCFTIFSSGLP